MVTGPVLVAVAALALLATFGRRRWLDATPGPIPSISVVVPARNEADTLPTLLSSIDASTIRPVELLVIDDGSTDDTAAIAVAHGAIVVTPASPPVGWNGKPWACAAGAQRAASDLLVHLDADTCVAPEALARLAGEWTRRRGLVSVQPSHHPQRAVEELSAIFNLTAVTGSGMFGVFGVDRAAAFGPCLVTSAEDLASVGGWASVRASVIEDVELAQRYRAHGLPVTVLLGGDDLSFRMYRTGRAVIEGWTKNIAAGALAAARWSTVATAVWVAAVVAIDIRFVHGVATWIGGGAAPVLAAACYAFVALGLWWALRQVGRFRWWTSAVHVVPLAFFVLVFARSMWLRLLGRPVTWRGRDVATRRSTS